MNFKRTLLSGLCLLLLGCATTATQQVDIPVYFGPRPGAPASKDFNNIAARDSFLLVGVRNSAGADQKSEVKKVLINNTNSTKDWATIQEVDVSGYTIIILPWMFGTAENSVKGKVEHAQ